MSMSAGFLQTQSSLYSTKIPKSNTSKGSLQRGKLRIVAAGPSGLDVGVRKLQAASSATASDTPTVSVVPGTEILPPPPPEIPATPSQGMDFVLEQLKAKEAASSLTPTVPKIPYPPPSGASSSSSSAIAPPQLPKLELPSLEMPSIEIPSVGLPSFNFDLKSASENIVPPKELNDSVSQASAAAAEAASQVTGAVGQTVSDATAAAATAATQLTEQLGGVASQAGSVVDGIQNEAASLVTSVQSTLDSTTSGLQSAAQSQLNSILDQLPPEVTTTVDILSSAANKAISAVPLEDPTVAAAAIAASIGLPLTLAWRAAYGGYAGSFSPQKAYDLLQTEDAVLVDIRTEQQRIDAGVPELKRGARGKGATVPPVQIAPSLSRRVRSPKDLALQITAAETAYLARIGSASATRVILLDARGDSAKAVARAATAAGLGRVYTVDGGFRAWKESLPVNEKASEYDDNPLGLVGDVAETAVEEATTLLQRPTTAAVLVGGSLFGTLLAYNYHTVLQYIGVLGLEATLAVRILSYDSPEDALEDLSNVFAKLTSLVNAPVSLLGALNDTVQKAQEEGQQVYVGDTNQSQEVSESSSPLQEN